MSKKPMGNPRKIDFRVLGRVLKMLFASYPVLIPITIFCIIFSAVVRRSPPSSLRRCWRS